MSKNFARTVKLVLSASFLILMALLLTWYKLTQPRILVLQSYDKGYAWTRDIDAGLKRMLDPKLRYRVYVHYMDVKKHPEKEFKRKAALLARRAIENINPTLIIAVDDDAQLVAKEFNDKPGISIVFAGVNGSIEPYGYHKAKNVTGILERKSLPDIRDALIALRRGEGKPLGTRVILIGDTSESVLKDLQNMRGFGWSPLKLVETKNVRTFEEWKAAVAEAGRRADILLVSNYRAVYRQEAGAELVPPQEIMRWTEQYSSIPAVGMNEFFTDDGGMFAVGASGFEQGETAGALAIRILDDHVSPRDIPVVLPQQVIIYMHKSLMQKRDITLPHLYESFARATDNYIE